MIKYAVRLYPKAITDMDNIYRYIAFQKLAPQNAKKQTDRIWNKLKTLETNPLKYQERQNGRYANKGYHQLLIDNYVAIYKIDEDSKTVFILTIQYQGRNI